MGWDSGIPTRTDIDISRKIQQIPGMARLVIPGLPHHVTQRVNRRQQTFFCDEDYSAYLELMAEWCAEREAALSLLPDAQSRACRGRRMGWSGRSGGLPTLCAEDQLPREVAGLPMTGAFCVVRDGQGYRLATARYVELNPVRARVVD